ncbi:MAG: CBS domain-containing protein [Candidatus Latescibacterota bacterium]
MQQKRVRDLMLPLSDYATVQADKTLREALEILRKAQPEVTPNRYQHRSVLVLDEIGKVIGKLSHWAVLRSLEPRFLKFEDEEALSRAGLTEEFIQSMRQTFSLFTGSLDHMCRAAAKLKARDAMVPVGESIDENMPLTDGIHQMVVKHALSILVTRKGEVVGILRQSDVFQEVADMIRSCET